MIGQGSVLHPQFGWKIVVDWAGRVLTNHPAGPGDSRAIGPVHDAEPQTAVGVLRGPDSFLLRPSYHRQTSVIAVNEGGEISLGLWTVTQSRPLTVGPANIPRSERGRAPKDEDAFDERASGQAGERRKFGACGGSYFCPGRPKMAQVKRKIKGGGRTAKRGRNPTLQCSPNVPRHVSSAYGR